MSADYERDAARAVHKHLTKAQADYIIRVVMNHGDRFVVMWHAMLAGRSIEGASPDEVERNLALDFLRCAEETMRLAPGGSS